MSLVSLRTGYLSPRLAPVLKIYSGGEPELIEGDVFKTIVPLRGIGAIGSTGAVFNLEVTENSPNTVGLSLPNGNDNGNDLNKSKQAILEAIRKKPQITLDQLVIVTGISKRTISRSTKELQESGTIRRIGSARAGYWELIE